MRRNRHGGRRNATCLNTWLRYSRSKRNSSLTTGRSIISSLLERIVAELRCSAEDETQTAYYTSMAARIWSSICKHRFDNLYGEEFARLDRHTRRRVELEVYDPLYMKVASTLVLGYNKAVTKKLDDIYVDDTTYTMHWRKFIGGMYDSWRDSRFSSTCLLM